MADWKQQLDNIRKLREQRSEANESLYSSQTNLIKSRVVLERAQRKMTGAPPDPVAINSVKGRIATLQLELQRVDTELVTINTNFTRLTQLTADIAFLEKKVSVLTPKPTDTGRPPGRVITGRARISPAAAASAASAGRTFDVQRGQLDEVKANLANAQAEHKKLLASQRADNAAKASLDKQRKATTVNLDKLTGQLSDLMTGNSITPEEAGRKKKEWEEKRIKVKSTLGQHVKDIRDAVVGIYAEDPHPRRAISNLEDHVPFLLFPVRIETKFMLINNMNQLWVRVYPDDIAIHTHEKTLTDGEVNQGRTYWTSVYHAEKSTAAEKENQKKSAWNMIVASFGSSRSSWIAREMKPTNWGTNASAVASADKLVFPEHDLTSTAAWSRAPRADVLPDRFVVMMYQGESLAKEFVGEIIPDQLIMGPDPMNAEAAFVTTSDEMLGFGTDFEWTADFDKAVNNGMGFRIALTQDEASKGFDKILVMGVFLSADQNDSKLMVESLIDNHHYSPDGFSIVKQGTATNNTEQDGSGFTRSDPFNAESYFVETGQPLFSDADTCDGKNLADALGIDTVTLQYIRNADARDLDEAMAMNKVLYPSTLGYYFDTMLKPVIDTGDQIKIRNFFNQHITGRGPLPAIRIGNQPYGVLLTSDFSRWKWTQTESAWGNKFLDTFYNVLNHYHALWKTLSSQLYYTGKPGVDPSDVLMNILGLQPGSVSFFQRVAFSTDSLQKNGELTGDQAYLKDLNENIVDKRVLQDFIAGKGYTFPATANILPQIMRLVFHHRQTQLDAANVIDNAPLSESDPIRFYDEAAKKNYLHWLMDTTTTTALEKQDFTPGKTPTSLLYMQLRRALLLEISKASVRWFGRNDIALDRVLEPLNFQNINAAPDLTKWEVMKAKISIVQPGHAQAKLSVADHLLTTGRNEVEAAYLNEMKASLKKLADLPTARLERCFTEHLDTCSYRLDAWQTGLFNQRLQKQRMLPDGTKSKGIFLGAYGCVFEVRPAAKRKLVSERLPDKLQPPAGKTVHEYVDNGGFVHTPSINQANAAAVLRSGYLNHASADNPDVMAVNLSSERVRRAMFVLDGIRKGQSLEALLGYQFERGLHDRGSANDALKRLNQYIYDFRDKFPIEQNLVQQQGSLAAPTETMKANNVVNGLKLAENTSAFPYGVTLDLSGINAALQNSIRDAIISEKDKLNDTLDAVKDLLLSESVYQMVQGNFDRTAAVANALKDANIPPEIEIVNTPQSSQLTFTNRVTIQFEQIRATDPGANPWAPVPPTVRSVFEPGLNKWLGQVIGPATNLSCVVFHGAASPLNFIDFTIDKLGIQPIDLVYIVGGEHGSGEQNRAEASELELRIATAYRREHALDDQVDVTIRFLETTAAGKKSLGSILPLLRMLKSVITDSRALDASDFDPASKPVVVDKTNPGGLITAELTTRMTNAAGEFRNALQTITALKVKPDASGEVSLGDFFSIMDESQQNITDVKVDFQDAQKLQSILVQISNFGIPDTFPTRLNTFDEASRKVLLQQAQDTVRKMKVMISTINTLMNEAMNLVDKDKRVNKLTEAGKALFGAAFNVLPQFTYNIPEDIRLSNADDSLTQYARQQMKMDFPADEWIHKLSHVRPKLQRWEYIRTLYELNHGDSLDISPIQVPYRSNDHWLAVDFPSTNADSTPFTIVDDTLSIVIHGSAAFATTSSQSGLLIDDWTEVIPNKVETTGITFNYNQPNAMPPQALLLAVTPVETGKWSWESLVGIVNDTFLRAKLRAVEPALLDAANSPEVGVLLPALISNFSKHDLDFSLDYGRNNAIIDNNLPLSAINFN